MERSRDRENQEQQTAIAECGHGDDGVPAKGTTGSHSSLVESDWPVRVATVCYSAIVVQYFHTEQAAVAYMSN